MRTKRVFFHGASTPQQGNQMFSVSFLSDGAPGHVLRLLLSGSVVSTLVTTPDFQVSRMDPVCKASAIHGHP